MAGASTARRVHDRTGIPDPGTALPPLFHGAIAALGCAPLVTRRRVLADPALPAAARRTAALWLLQHGQPRDHAASKRFLAEISAS
ncbi:hypothetical protein [Nioella sp.]|uniref:hypothetical protein n=1 Tax=Nioella sp. TaxID=1912091 RepID=UPI0035119B27